jgi:hypothetical protein
MLARGGVLESSPGNLVSSSSTALNMRWFTTKDALVLLSSCRSHPSPSGKFFLKSFVIASVIDRRRSNV